MKRLIIIKIMLCMSLLVFAQENLNVRDTLLTEKPKAANSVYQQRFDEAIAQMDTCRECGVEALLALRKEAFAPEIVRLNSTIVLANVCLQEGDAEGLDICLTDIEQYVGLHSDDEEVKETLAQLRKWQTEMLKEQQDFRERLVGTWVTAETSVDLLNEKERGYPCHIVDIRYNDSTFVAQLDRSLSWEYPTFTDNIDIYGAQKRLDIHFGTERKKEANTHKAQSLMNSVRENSQKAADYKARTGRTDHGTDIANIILMSMAKSASVARTYYHFHDLELKEIAPDILKGTWYYECKVERSDGGIDKANHRYVRQTYLYRITPEDTIGFALPKVCAKKAEKNGSYDVCDYLVDLKQLNKEGKKQMPEGRELTVTEWNQNAYARLRAKIMERAKDLDAADAEWVENEMEWGPKGYAWNDGHYATSPALLQDGYGYDEAYKGPYSRKLGYGWGETIQDFWKMFDRDYDMLVFPNVMKWDKTTTSKTVVPKYFIMKSEQDAKHSK